jgi:hypothetical protein
VPMETATRVSGPVGSTTSIVPLTCLFGSGLTP